MRVSAQKMYSVSDTVSTDARSDRTRIALTSPLIAYSAAAAGSVAVWAGLFKLIFG